VCCGRGQGGGFDLRFLRLARVFRVFKLSRYGHRMQLIVDALQESREILLMLSVNLVILVSRCRAVHMEPCWSEMEPTWLD
jgi:hypothetical protein